VGPRSRLEARLGVRLLERTTRSIGLTTEGAAYDERCTKILRELEDANVALAGARATPRGRLRVDAPSALSRYVIAPAVPLFLQTHPELSLELSLRDHLVDPIAEGIDVVVRMAEPRDSELIAKKVGTNAFYLVGSPQYLKRRGRPRSPQDLRRHDTIAFFAGGSVIPWRFRSIAGLGLAQILDVVVRDDVSRGKLEIVLPDYEPAPRTIYAVYTRDKASLPKVRVFLEFLAETLKTTAPLTKRRSRPKSNT
jgi:LysR family transcriptional regulator for bpeEF and oprC